MSELDTFLSYDCEGDQYTNSQQFINFKGPYSNFQEDPLISNIKEEVDIKSEPEDFCEWDVKSVTEEGNVSSKKRNKNSPRKSNRAKKTKDYDENSEASDREVIKKKSKNESKQKKKSKNKTKKSPTKYLTHAEQILPDVKSAVQRTFLSSEDSKLSCVNYKDVEVTRRNKKKGYNVKEDDLNKFKKDESGVASYRCEDCDFNSEKVKSFKLHFILHANIYHTVQSINKTLQTFYCYLCDKECQSDSLLKKHLNKHREKKSKDEKITVEEPPQEDLNWDLSGVWQSKDSPSVDNDVVDYDDDDDDFYDEMPLFDYMRTQRLNNEVKDEITEPTNKIDKEIKLEVDLKSELSDNKEVVEIKKEVEGNDELVTNCYIKLENLVDSALLKVEEIKKAKCPECNYESDSGNLFKHRCKEVRQCDMCDKMLSTQRIYRYHRKLHFCDKCSFKSANTEDVVNHRKTSKECWSKCDNCEFKTMSNESYARHIKTKTCFKDKNIKLEKSEELLYCDVCAYKTRYKEILVKHIKQHKTAKYSEKDAFACGICNKPCYSKTTLQTHFKSHFCGICPFMAVNAHDVFKHRKGSPSCLFRCTKCSFTSTHKVSMRRHVRILCGIVKNITEIRRKTGGMRKAKNLLCDMCDYKTNSEIYLEAHKKKHVDPKPYQCSQCGFRCSQKGNLIIHEKKHIDGKSYCCNLCDFQCSRAKVFVMHKKIHGIEESDVQDQAESKNKDPRFLYCDRCEFRSKYPQYLKNHMMKHDNIRSHLCPFCGMSFYSLIDYHVHKRSAHAQKDVPQKMYKCSYCDYSYCKKATVIIHERKHTGAKPHTCEFCSYSTSYSGNLRAHRKKHISMNATLNAN